MDQRLSEMLIAAGIDPAQYEVQQEAERTKPTVPTVPSIPAVPTIPGISEAPIEALAGERIPGLGDILSQGYNKWQASRGFLEPTTPTPAPVVPTQIQPTIPMAPVIPAALPSPTVTAPLPPQKTEQILEGKPGVPSPPVQEPKEGEIKPTEEGLAGIETMYEKPLPTEAPGIAAMPTEKYMTPEDYAKQAETIRAESKAKALAISQKQRPTVQGQMDAAGKSRLDQLVHVLSYNLFGGDSRKLYEKIDTQLQADFDRQTLEELKQNSQDEVLRFGLTNMLLKASDEKREMNTKFLLARLEKQPELLMGPNAEKNLLLLSNQLGWSPESTKAYLESNRDPKTGKLTLGYLTEAERWVTQKKDMAEKIHTLFPTLPIDACHEIAMDPNMFKEWVGNAAKILDRKFANATTPEEKAQVSREIMEFKRYQQMIQLEAIKSQMDGIFHAANLGLIDPASAKRFARDYIAASLAGKETVKGIYDIEQEKIKQAGETARKGMGAGTENLAQKRVQVLNTSEGRTIQFLNPGLINQAAAGEAGAEEFTKTVANLQGIIRLIGNDPRTINKNLTSLPPENQKLYQDTMRAQQAAIGSSPKEGGLGKPDLLRAIGGGASASELDSVMRMIIEGKPDKGIYDAVINTRQAQAATIQPTIQRR